MATGDTLPEHAPALFDGLPEEDVAELLGQLDAHQFSAGATILAEGDSPRSMYVIQSGAADIYVADRQGVEHHVGRAGPGDTLGEMSLFTGQPISATVRATSTLVAFALDAADFDRTASRYPRIYRNIGVLLSRRLARANRRGLHDALDRIAVLVDEGAAPLLGYALACSVAWHTRGATLLLVVTEGELTAEVRAVAATVVDTGSSAHQYSSAPYLAAFPAPGPKRATLVVAPPRGAFAPEALAATAEELCAHYDHVLVQVREGAMPALLTHTVRLCPGRAGRTTGAPGYALRGWAPVGTLRPDGAGCVDVPPPGPGDEEALRAGVLPPVTPTGRALGWIARDLSKLKVGLALGAGAARGYAHLGVLRTLTARDLPIDYVAGTSIGAIVASLYALGYDVDTIARMIDEVSGSIFRPALPTAALLSSAKLRARLQKIGEGQRIEDLGVPLAIVAVDLVGRREVVFRRGLLWAAVLASMSIPGIYPPQRIGAYTLVDGGVLNPVPSNAAARMGADVVIAVKLAGPPAPIVTDAEARAPSGRAPAVLHSIMGAIDMMQSKIVTDTAAAATIVIEPDLVGGTPIGLRQFTQGRRYIARGEAAAEDALPRIAAALPWLRP